ncbi:uncharacterized protein METZ01_LOCUS99838 [marine metagenome]|uniref:Omp28-related outer membrane protein n=1 Tax=marine metagenome TaxID=408172 RepID=A0A381W3C7_9ZZZZ
MKIIDSLYHLAIIGSIIFVSCSETDDDDTFYDDWTVVGSGSSASVTKNVLTEFVGSTKCPYCPAKDSLLLSYFDSGHENFVGSDVTDNWFLINYHTYSPSRGDPMYEFHRGVSETGEDDYCFVRFEEGDWYNIGGVPITYTNGNYSNVDPEMAVGPMAESTPLQMSLEGTRIDGMNITVQVSINSSRDMSASDSLYLFIAATMDNVDYEGYNGEKHHQDVFLGWVNAGLSGELLSLGNEEVVKSYAWEMPENWPQNNYETTWWQVEWDASNLAVVAFIQNIYTKEIVQVAGKY